MHSYPWCLMEVSGQFHALVALPLVPRLGGAHSQSGCGGGEKNSQSLLGIKSQSSSL